MADALEELIAGHDGFEHAGLRTGLVESSPGPGLVQINGRITAEGEPVGRFAVMVFRARNGSSNAVLQALYLAGPYTNRGFAPAFADNLYDLYRRAGIDTFQINASEYGAYATARRRGGYAFAGDARLQVAGIWNDHGSEALAEAQTKGGLPAEEAKRIDRLFADVEAGKADPPAPYELAELGEGYSWEEDGHRLWLGKRMLIGTRWSATKSLR